MGCMAKKFLLLIFFTLFAFQGFGAELKTNVEDNKAEFVFSFQKGYSAFDQLLDETSNTLIFTFDTSENIEFARQNYFDMPIKSVYLTTKDKKRFYVEFKNNPIEPIINKTNKQISIVFPFPAKTVEQSGMPIPAGSTNTNASMPSTSSYVKMISGLIFVLIMIFLLFFVLKIFFKKQLFSDIPGSGRLLGKVDLELRKSLYFYEIGDIIYILGVTDNGMNMGHHGIWGKGNGTYPQNMYDSAIKVPLIISMPQGAKGEVCSQMCCQYDFFPTILAMAGCSEKLEKMQPGKSMTRLLENPKEKDEERIVVFDEYSNTRMIRTKQYKYIHRYPDGPDEFYDMKNDPCETKNLAQDAAYKDRIDAMKSSMEEWFDRYAVKEMDARQFYNTGRGQTDICYKENAFDTTLEYYHSETSSETGR